MDQRRLLLAAALSLAVLIVWQVIFPAQPDNAGAPPEVVAESQIPVEPAAASPFQTQPAPPAAASTPEAASASQPDATAGTVAEAVAATAEEHPTIETEAVRAVFTNRGAQLVSFVLKQHPSVNSGQVEMIRLRDQAPYAFALTRADGSPSALNEALFVIEKSRGMDNEEVVTFRYSGPAGQAQKRFTLRPGGLFDVEVSVEGESGWGVQVGPGLRNPTADEVNNRFSTRAAVYKVGEDVEVVNSQGVDVPIVVSGAGMRWFGLEDTYFLSAMIPRTPVDSIIVQPILVDRDPESGVNAFTLLPPEDQLTDAQEEMARELILSARVVGTEFAASAFWGAKDHDELSALGVGLEETVNWGWFGIVVGPLQKGLRWIYNNIVPNYGWAIILMTTAIKILLMPLTHKSYVSMQKMQEVNPKIQAIRNKYRPKMKDKKGKPNPEASRKMNEEIMALYKAEKVNPAGGCLPMVLQLPVFFSFYRLLYTAVELRGAPWIFWIHDLSVFDPFYILPVVMGASQFLQQKLTPASGDPMQRRIFLMMPVVFTFLFLKFPSGLVIYWLTNNVLTIVQQVVYQQWKKRKLSSGGGGTGAGLKKAATG